MKLTDIMFNLDYIAANVGADKVAGGNVFKYDTVTYAGTALDIPAVPVVTNGVAKVYYKAEGSTDQMIGLAPNANGKYEFPANGKYCVMYRKEEAGAETIEISSQFIPDTLHAVLTVALYSGDSCNAESATKAGEIVIDIPRFQLSGAMDISMTATGASQTALDGQALASGCTSCDGKAIYATITKFLTGSHWYDDAQGIVIEDLSGMKAGDNITNKEVAVYAYYANKAPKKIDLTETYVPDPLQPTVTALVCNVTFTPGATELTYSAGKLNGNNIKAGTATLDIVVAPKTTLETNKNIVVAAN